MGQLNKSSVQWQLNSSVRTEFEVNSDKDVQLFIKIDFNFDRSNYFSKVKLLDLTGWVLFFEYFLIILV